MTEQDLIKAGFGDYARNSFDVSKWDDNYDLLPIRTNLKIGDEVWVIADRSWSSTYASPGYVISDCDITRRLKPGLEKVKVKL